SVGCERRNLRKKQALIRKVRLRAARRGSADCARESDIERSVMTPPCPRRRVTQSSAQPCDDRHIATPLTRGGVAPHLRAPQRLRYLPSGPSRAFGGGQRTIAAGLGDYPVLDFRGKCSQKSIPTGRRKKTPGWGLLVTIAVILISVVPAGSTQRSVGYAHLAGCWSVGKKLVVFLLALIINAVPLKAEAMDQCDPIISIGGIAEQYSGCPAKSRYSAGIEPIIVLGVSPNMKIFGGQYRGGNGKEGDFNKALGPDFSFRFLNS